MALTDFFMNAPVLDLLDRKDRVNELGRLVSLLPIANYTLLRALTAHLIQVVQHSDVNKMTMRNVSIVFSPTLGIPGTIFNLLMSEFDYIFWTTEDGDAAPRMILDDENTVYETPTKVMEDDPAPPPIIVAHDQPPAAAVEESERATEPPSNKLGRKPTLQLKDGRSNRNSVNYREAAPNTIVELEKHHHHNHHHHGK
jgi:RalA-binding protein 1